MLTEEQVIERIRTQLYAELDGIHPPVSVLADAWEHAHEQQTAERRRRRHHGFSRQRIRIRHIGLGLAIAVPVLVAALAVVLLGHSRSASPTRPGHARLAITPSRTGASSSIDAALARGNRPPAPSSTTALPIVGSSATRTLRSFRGKVVVLNVFASWCQPCKAQTAALEQAQAVIAGQGATVLGVTYEDHPAASEAFVRAMHITYPVLRDTTGRFGRSFGITGVPETFVIDRRSRIAAVLRSPVDDRWLNQTLGRLIPAGLPLESPPTASELAAVAKAYPVLGHRQQPTDIPAHGVLDPYVVSRGGLAANSRRAVVTARGESLFIVPAHHSICVTSSDNVVEGCQPFPFTARTPADISATICAPGVPSTELEVAGLMPPDASDIKADYSDGSSQVVTATNGMIAIYARRAGPLPKSITWMSPRGPEHTATAVPPDASSSTCVS